MKCAAAWAGHCGTASDTASAAASLDCTATWHAPPHGMAARAPPAVRHMACRAAAMLTDGQQAAMPVVQWHAARGARAHRGTAWHARHGRIAPPA